MSKLQNYVPIVHLENWGAITNNMWLTNALPGSVFDGYVGVWYLQEI